MRYGKVIDFKCAPAARLRASHPLAAVSSTHRARACPARLSELRAVELLDGLCDRVSSFALWTPSAAWAEANPTESADASWVRITGDGAHVQGATGTPAAATRRACGDSARLRRWKVAQDVTRHCSRVRLCVQMSR